MVLHRLYTETINGLKRRFTADELTTMIEASGDLYLDPAGVIDQMKICIEAIPGGETDKQELLGKLIKLNNWEAACLQIWARDYWEQEKQAPIDKYIKQAPAIIAELAEISARLNKSVSLQIQHKQAVKSKTAAIAREETERALDIIKRIIGN